MSHHLASPVVLGSSALQVAISEARFASAAAWVAVAASIARSLAVMMIAAEELRRARRLRRLTVAKDYVAALRLWSELRKAAEHLLGEVDGDAEMLTHGMATFLETIRAIRVSAANLLRDSNDPRAILRAGRAAQVSATTDEVVSRALMVEAESRTYPLRQYALTTARFIIDDQARDPDAETDITRPIPRSENEPVLAPRTQKAVDEGGWTRVFARIFASKVPRRPKRRSSLPRIERVEKARPGSVDAELALP